MNAVLDPECDAPAKYLRRACDVSEEAGVLLLLPEIHKQLMSVTCKE
jgi:hypothetical protein